MLQRRMFLLAAAGSLLVARSGLAEDVPHNLIFRVMRKGSDIGRHTIDFKQQGDRLQVTTMIDIAVKIAFITVATFKQDAVEDWQADRVVAGQSQVTDDGKVTNVTIASDAGKLVVDGPKGSMSVPLGIMTDISFWNEAIVHKSKILDTQTTDIISMTTTGGVREMVDMGDGRVVEGVRYDMASNAGRSGKVWYAPDGRFLRTEFTTRGELLEYYPIT